MAQDSKWVHITGAESDHPIYRKSGATKDICKKCGQLIVERAKLDAAEADQADAEAVRRLAAANIEVTGASPEEATEIATEIVAEAEAKPKKAKAVKEAPAHKIRWFATIDGKRAARTGDERGEVRWDAECTDGYTTGEPQVFAKVRKAVNVHLGKATEPVAEAN